jgi:hypothetical protein
MRTDNWKLLSAFLASWRFNCLCICGGSFIQTRPTIAKVANLRAAADSSRVPAVVAPTRRRFTDFLPNFLAHNSQRGGASLTSRRFIRRQFANFRNKISVTLSL